MNELIQEPRLWGGICLLIWAGTVIWSLKGFIARRRTARNRQDSGILLLIASGLLWLVGWGATAWVAVWVYAWISSSSVLLPLLVMLARTGVDAIFLGGLHPPRPVTGLHSILGNLGGRLVEEMPRVFFFYGMFGLWLGGMF